MRRPHHLRGTRSNEQPSNIVWFDTETRYRVGPDGRQIHRLWFGWAAYQRRRGAGKWSAPEWHRFSTIDGFWRWTLRKSRAGTRLVTMAHSGGFDLPVLHAFSELPARGWTLKSAVVDAPPMILRWQQGDRSVQFIDTLNIWRMPLDAIGESIGIPKLPMPSPSDSRSKWDRYCKRDVEVIRQAVLRWLDFLTEHDFGGFAPTLASQAMRTYTHRFMEHKILIDASEEGLELAREAYLGGRVECFRIGTYKGDFSLLDVSSLYPSVMHDEVFPRALIGVYGRPTRQELSKWLRERCVIADCLIETDEPAYPVLHEGRLCFPVGRFRATLCGPELAHAIECRHWQSSERAAVYHAAPLFRTYVETLYGLKLQAQQAEDLVSRWMFKYLLNQLYGKFGQRGRRHEIIGEENPDDVRVWSELDLDSGEVRHMRCFGGILQEWQDEGEGRDSSPAIAAYVCSYGRMRLWRALEHAGRENVLYCDTDSLVVNPEGLDRMAPLIDPEQLGAWTVEDTFPSVTLHGPKDYVFGERKRTKGVRRNATWLAEGEISQDYFVGFKGLLRLGSLDAPIVGRVTKRLRREYLKGRVSPDGQVHPFVLSL